jgi:hypothetical protein
MIRLSIRVRLSNCNNRDVYRMDKIREIYLASTAERKLKSGGKRRTGGRDNFGRNFRRYI